MPGYSLHDLDYVIISDEMFLDCHHVYQIDNGVAKDMFYWKKHSPEWHISRLSQHDSFALDIAHVLVPAVAKELCITVSMLSQLTSVAMRLSTEFDGKYDYYRIILNAYLENDEFFLTDEQRLAAYKAYKKYR